MCTRVCLWVGICLFCWIPIETSIDWILKRWICIERQRILLWNKSNVMCMLAWRLRFIDMYGQIFTGFIRRDIPIYVLYHHNTNSYSIYIYSIGISFLCVWVQIISYLASVDRNHECKKITCVKKIYLIVFNIHWQKNIHKLLYAEDSWSKLNFKRGLNETTVHLIYPTGYLTEAKKFDLEG